MFFKSAFRILSALLCLEILCEGRALSNRPNACEIHGEYSNSFSCYDFIHTESGKPSPTDHRLLKQEVQRILETFSEPCPRQPIILTGSPVQKSTRTVLGLEVPLPTTYLMSKVRPGTPEDFIALSETNQQSNLAQVTPPGAVEFSDVQTRIQEERLVLCLQQVEGSSNAVCWDQNRSVNAVIGIVVLFLAVVLVAETADKLFKVLVPL